MWCSTFPPTTAARTLKALTDRADVFVTNMRPDALAKCGADADTLCADNPALVHCVVRGFGSDGPYADLPAYDDIAAGRVRAGRAQEWMAGEPQYVASAVGDKVSGVTAALAIVAALHGRTVDGEGSVIEVPMAETLTAFGLVEHLWGRHLRTAAWRGALPSMSVSRSDVRFPSDGWISVVVYSDQNWMRFFELIGLAHLADEPRFASFARAPRTSTSCTRSSAST